jgi:trehalose 6-phosphate phosphatase
LADETQTAFALFLDFDGTLVDIAERPDDVVVDPALPGTLARLRDWLGGALALVSGRPIHTLDHLLRPQRFDAAGLHGVEQRVGERLFPCTPEDHPDLRRAIEDVGQAVAEHQGLIVEDKGCSFAVHWRLRPDLADEAAKMAEDAASRLGPRYRLQRGKAVAEILPANAGKGPAIGRFLERPPYRGRRPIFIGDDLTDEHGFAAVNERDGFSIRIGSGPTIARRRIGSPTQLRILLTRWAAEGRIYLQEELAG